MWLLQISTMPLSAHQWEWWTIRKRRARPLLLIIIAIFAMLRWTVKRNYYDSQIYPNGRPPAGIFNCSTDVITMESINARLHQYGPIAGGYFPNVAMGRAPQVSLQDAVDVVKEFMRFFLTNDLPAYTSKTWIDMSDALGRRWSPHNVYTHVRENRRGIVTLAKEQLGIQEPSVERERLKDQDNDESRILDDNDIDYTKTEDDSSFNSTSDTKKIKTDKFKLVLSQEDWDSIKPDISGDLEKPALVPGVWTNVLAIAFWEQYKLECAYVFKRADVKLSADGQYDIKVEGRCTSAACGNRFVGKAMKDVGEIGGLTMDVDTRDTRGETHEQVKRPLNGKRRREIEKELIAEGCAAWKKRTARQNMKMGDPIPPIIPSDDVLKRARKDGIDRELNVQSTDARDIIRTIEELAGTVEYAGLIDAVGSIPFFVFYSTPAQLHVYNEYCRIYKNTSVISLDATGSLVTKLTRPDNQKTGHIFLYSVVINFEKTTLPVYQMLSEKHHTEFIQFWIQSWIRSGARKPREAICDYSRALIAGITLAFNNMTVKMYVNICFAMGQMIGCSNKSIVTFVRIDVSHLVHMVCLWKSLKCTRQKAIKEFYVRCVGLMIESQSITQFSEMFLLTCTVGVQEYDDSIVEYPQQATTREARRKLEGYIAVGTIDVDFAERVSDSTNDDLPADSEDDTPSTGTPIERWVEDLVTRARKIIRTGVELNPFYLPDFVQRLSQIAKEFPLWTAATLPYEAQHATSSYVEGYFNDLKTRVLKNNARPMRVDKFVKKHANDITGATLLSCAKLIDFEKRGGSVPILASKNVVETDNTPFIEEGLIEYDVGANDSDLLAQENWRAKATVRNIEDSENRSNNITEEFNWSQSQIERELGPIPTCFKMLDDLQIESILLDHSYNAKSEVQTHIDNINEIEEVTPICANVMNIDAFETIQPEQKESNELTSTEIDGQISLDKNHRSKVQSRHLDGTTELKEETPISANTMNIGAFETIEPEQMKTFELTSTEVDGQISLDKNYRSKVQSRHIEGTNTTDLKEETPINANMPSIAVIEAVNPKKTKSKYFKAFPEIRQMNLLTKKSNKPSLLPNGSVCRRPAKVDGNMIFIEFTCAFDSLASIIMIGAIDDIHYASFVEQSETSMLKFVASLVNNGVTAAVLRDRIIILKSFNTPIVTKKTNNRVVSYTINAWDSIANVVNNTLTAAPSVFETRTCSLCPRRQTFVPCIAVNHRIIVKEGFGSLEKALSFRSRIYNVQCCKPCTGRYILDKSPNVHVFIELDIRNTGPAMPISKSGMECKLQQVPVIIRLPLSEELEAEYRLIGVVGYKSRHFTAYCRRNNGTWQKYDDFRQDVSNCNSRDDIEPHLAVYLRQYGDNCDSTECPCNSRRTGQSVKQANVK